MSMLEKLEKEFSEGSSKTSEDNKKTINEDPIDHASHMFSQVLGDRDFEKLADPKRKEDIRGLLDILEKFYQEKVAPATATNQDLFDYIPLFCINGALIATRMNIVYEDYLKLVDIMMVVLGIMKEEV